MKVKVSQLRDQGKRKRFVGSRLERCEKSFHLWVEEQQGPEQLCCLQAILIEQVAISSLHTWGQPLRLKLAKEDGKAKKSLESLARALPTAPPINNQYNRGADLDNEGKLL